MQIMPRAAKVPECHPDRGHYAKGLCRECYQKQVRAAYDSQYEASEAGQSRAKKYNQSEKGLARKRAWAAKTRKHTAIQSDKEIVLGAAQDWITVSDLRSRRRRFLNASKHPHEEIVQLFRALAEEGLGETEEGRTIRFRRK